MFFCLILNMKIKITTNNKEELKQYMTSNMSFNNGIIEIIVGWDLAKSKGASILEHKMGDNLYWTFSPREKRKVFEGHLKSFFEEFIENLIKKIKTKNLDPINFDNKESYIDFIKKHISGCEGYLYSDRLYVYCDNLIYHIDVGLLNFMSWDIINEIKNLIKLKENKEIPKTMENLDIKYIHYLDAKENNISSNIY